MTPRSIRRAAERKAMKAARKAERSLIAQFPTQNAAPETALPQTPESAQLSQSDFQHRAVNLEGLCRNPEPTSDSPVDPLLFTPAALSAQLYTGLTSNQGKVTASLNTVKTALTGRTVLLPTDEAPQYQAHLGAYEDDFKPVGQRESDLVQSIADTMWRLKRIPGLENALFAQGHIEFAEAFNQHEAPLRSSMIEVQTFLKYEKQLRNLQLQESRLARRREKEIQELRQLQQERRSREQEALETAAKLHLAAQEAGQPFEPAVNGFVFSTAEIEQHLSRVHARRRNPMHADAISKQAA